MEDVTKTDGDQVARTWYYQKQGDANWTPITSMAGYADHSVGTGKKVGFLKEGVGAFQIKLDVKDLWSEETLAEYVTEDECKTGSVTASAEVINVAPVVSLTPLSSKTADIIILTVGPEEFNRVKENQALITQTLLQHGVDANIVVEEMNPVASQPEGQAATKLMEADTPFGYEGGWTFYENQNFIVDEERLFKIDATWPNTDIKGYPESPYTISCWQAKTGNLLWTYTFTDQLMTVSDRQNESVFTQDDSGRYLFFSSDGKTLMLTKDNGSFITVLNMEIGDNVFSEGDSVYTLKEDGIYSISLQSGQTKKVYRGNIAKGTARRLEGKIHFLTLDGLALFRGIFDPAIEKVKLERIMDNPTNDGLVSYKLLGIDVSGKLIVNAIIPLRGNGTYEVYRYQNTILVYGRDNRLVFNTSMTDSNQYTYTATPVYDEGGECNYLVYTWDTRSSRRYSTHASVLGINNGYSGSNYVSDTNGYPSMASQVIFARELSGKVYVSTGAYWTWIYGTNSYGNGPAHGYPERTKVFTFDPAAGTVTMGHVSDLGLGIVTREYGVFSDTLAAIQTGNNHPGLSNGNETVVVTWEQTLSDILNRYVNKHFNGYKDINALVVYDETNSEDQYTSALLDSLENKLGNKNGKLIITNREDVEGKELGESILALGDEERNVLGIEVEGGTFGRLTKTYNLEPDTTYYYEYDLKQADGSKGDKLNVSFNVQTTSENELLSEAYKVTEVHLEDFDDRDTDPFFRLEESRMKEGIYSGAHPYNRQGKDWKNRLYQDNSSLTFSIPSGKKAVLSFDWQVYMDGTQAWMANYIKINDKLWNVFLPESGSGHYTHSTLLPEGESTIYFYAGAYGGRITEAKMWIDNLRVEIIDPQPSEPDLIDHKQTSTVEPLSDDYTRIEGSFRTPPLVGYYSLMENAEVISGPIGEDPYTVWDSVEEGRKQASYNIPEGKTAIYTLLSTWSRPNYYNDRNYPSRYVWGTYQWQCSLRNKYPENALYNCPADYIITLPSMTGSQTFNQNSPTYRGAYGDFVNIASVLVDTNDNRIGNLGFFLENSPNGLECYKEDYVYQKQGNVTFHLPQGNHTLRNLKIYSIQKGVKVYAADETFVNSAKLQEWETDGAKTAVVREGVAQNEDKSLVYKKNQLIAYNINYYDYEGDPSKREYWRYAHTPANDGPHPDAAEILDEDGGLVSLTGKVLDSPIKRFSIDGKYRVEHWQEDNTGNPNYDRLSNVETTTFYIEGGASAPWVESIRTIPGKIKEGNNYSLEIKVDDLEKDILRLHTEVYLNKKLIYAHRENGITADDNGTYPAVPVSAPQSARPGSYEVVCTVRDDSGAGFGSYRFVVTSLGKIYGSVYHTDEWDKNRKKYNTFYFNEEFNQSISYSDYLTMRAPRKRGINVFWSGERFLLSASVAGNPEKVTVHIPGTTEQTSLVDTGRKNRDGETIYEGSLWNSSMVHRWGRKKPEEVDFRFTAHYSGNNTKIFDTKVILDSGTDYWLLHRLW
ncbi:MAG: hypothetical protein PHR60_03825 [Eubacteriales bacterium]|nr:hypothetical protein [Eubacteriales bacterium]